jgi:cyclopropane-fatty-acyl-phospholipid synthase
MTQAMIIEKTDYAVRHAITILQRFFPSPRNFIVRLWDHTELPADSDPKFTLVINQPGALRRMLSPSVGLSLAEAYISGDFDIEGDFYTALDQAISPAGLGLTPTEITSLQLDFRLNDNPSNEFFALWLDKRMQYSCGYFLTGMENLETAQALKIDHICQKLRLKPGERLLVIDCGWGGLAIAAAQRYQAEVVGVTPNEQQAAYGTGQVSRMGLGGQVKILNDDYLDLKTNRFDKIVSVGKFEPVGRRHLPEYFSHVFHLLKPGGLFLNQGISRRGQRSDLSRLKGPTYPTGLQILGQTYFQRDALGSGNFSPRHIVPDGEMVTLSEANLVAESTGLEVREVECLREHYALTLRHWVSRIEEHKDEAVQLVGEAEYRAWQLYLSFYVLGFEAGRINASETLFAKPPIGKANSPLYLSTR